MHRFLHPLAAVIGFAILPFSVSAHFKLLEPAEWLTTNQLGDPQKFGPCGGDPSGDNQKILTNASTKVAGGSKLHLKIQETVFHSGHYRAALAVNSRADLPPDPLTVEKWTAKGPFSAWAQIQSPPQIPVIADGLFPHYAKSGEPSSRRVDPGMPMIWEADIELPNINCPKCTLQVIQFMADHPYNIPGGYSYHHCAALEISADPNKPIDTRWPAAVSK
ncbi:MAG TPA: SCE4755 family polysaccharide monooxygenase-like protein [Terriglobales bacterium]|nr:SCE4755 family polysaccharide monooxygenase-like protein [Terriglobales bacterium]